MELLGILEKKIERLVSLARELKTENERLCADNFALKERLTQQEQALLKNNEGFKEWDREKASARKAVDELISDIDSLIESGS